jgi:hypothetical protein
VNKENNRKVNTNDLGFTLPSLNAVRNAVSALLGPNYQNPHFDKDMRFLFSIPLMNPPKNFKFLS